MSPLERLQAAEEQLRGMGGLVMGEAITDAVADWLAAQSEALAQHVQDWPKTPEAEQTNLLDRRALAVADAVLGDAS